jgi:hypothetical protein
MKWMTHHAAGTFVVKLTSQTPVPETEDPTIGRMLSDKEFLGDLAGASKGQMISTMGEVKGSAGYVAMERVTGSLNSRAGSFALQHTGTMARGVPSLSVTVVPDTGTGGLAGLTGSMTIQIDAGKHSYTFDYTLPEEE